MPWEDWNLLEQPYVSGVAPLATVGGSGVAPAAPAMPTPWEHAQNQNTGFKYTPAQLGWDDATAQRLSSAGITSLPGWFSKEMVYSPAFHLGSRDPVQNYIDLYKTPYDQAIGQWDASKKAYGRLFGEGGVDTSTDAAKEAYLRDAFGFMNNARDSWWDRNKGAVMGLGSVASVALGGYLSGAMSPAVAGAEGAAGAFGGTAEGAMAGAGGGAGTFDLSTMATPTLGTSSTAPVAGQTTTSGLAGLSGPELSVMTGAQGGWSLADLGTYLNGPVTTALGGGSGVGFLDSISGLFGGGGSTASSGTGMGDWLKLATVLGSGIYGGIKGNESMQDAIDAAGQQTDKSIAFQKYMYDTALQNYAPFRDLGVTSLSGLKTSDPTGGSGKYITALEGLGSNFRFDESDPAYRTKLEQSTKAVNQALAARGMYNSRAGLNMLDESTRNIMAEEYDKQYQRKYTNLMDLYNMSSKQGLTDYSKLLDMVKIGAGAAGQAGSAATSLGNSVASSYGNLSNLELASGKSSADLWSGLGSMPMNYLLLSSILGKK